MTDKPDTLFERHPRPWRFDCPAGLRVLDANNGVVIEGHASIGALVDLINADAPKPFVPGWYWAKTQTALGAARESIFEIHTASAMQSMIDNAWTIGPRVEKPEF